MTFTEYLTKKRERILTYVEEPVLWNNLKAGGILDERFKKACNNLHFFMALPKEARLSRDDVSAKWSKSLYEGFVATLMWAGYHKGGITSPFLAELAGQDPNEVEARLLRVHILLKRGDVSAAYHSLEPKGGNKLVGMSSNSFTKLLYFLGRDTACSPKPLIYDYYAAMMHECILAEHSLAGPKRKRDKYLEFNSLMQQYAERIGTSAEQLQSYLRGWSETDATKSPADNPRTFLRSLTGR